MVDLIYLSRKKMNVVLGMDWLSANATYIGRKKKEIYIPKEPISPREVISELLEGKTNMIHCLYYEEIPFLLILTMDSKERNVISSISIVCDFLDVFPEDVTSLPPIREVKFYINLVLGTHQFQLCLIECIHLN